MIKQHRFLGMSMALCAAICASSAGAKTTLESKDGSFVLQGTILNVTDQQYTIRTDLGEMVVFRELVNCNGDDCPSETEAAAVAPAAPGSRAVTLSSPDGNVSLEGELTGFDDRDYYLRTDSGDLVIARAFVNCEGDACPTVEVITKDFALVGPQGDGADIMSAVIKSFATAKGYKLPEVVEDDAKLALSNEAGDALATISVSEQSTEDAIKTLLDKNAAFVVTRTPATPEMLSKLTGRSVTSVDEVLDGQIIGLDALSVVTNPNNTMTTLAMENVNEILSGKLTNWAQVGGADADINLHLLEKVTGEDTLIAASFTEPKGNKISRHADASALKEAVASDENAIGVIYRSQADDLNQMNLTSACNIHYDTSNFSIQSNEYPAVLNLYAYVLREEKLRDTASNLLSFLNADAGQKALTDLGMVGQNLQTEPMRDQGARVLSAVLSADGDRAYDAALRDYFKSVSHGTRLSTALRFVSGSSTPDQRAIQDIQRISGYIRKAANQGQKLTVVGFSDAYGDFGNNLSLSKGRAAAIKAELLARNPGWLEDADIEILGAGPVAPVECNTSAKGRELNRRVEIWVSPKR